MAKPAKPKDTAESMCKNSQQQDCLKELKKSPLFYLSAGSKELFHSNFLYWLATQHWDVFSRVMRNLAGLNVDETFWWEESATFDARNLKVKREQSHFDLSIYHRFEADKWVPVLILENKVKSLPYAKQLLEYSKKAETEWGGIENNGKDLITFILLSLTDAISLDHDSKLELWTFRNYADLANVLENNLDHLKGYPKQLCDDYCHFIRALSSLAENWKVDTSDGYITRLCPQVLKNKDDEFYIQYTELSKLRLNDIWQKVSFDKLRILLEEMLENQLPENKNKINPYLRDKKTPLEPGFYLATGYTRDTGLIELRYVLEDYPEKKEPISVMIQIQGSQYRYAVTANTKVCKTRNRKVYPIGKAKEHNFNEWLSEHPDLNNSWCHYGEYFIYRYRKIKPSETIENIIYCIVDDAKGILINFRRS